MSVVKKLKFRRCHSVALLPEEKPVFSLAAVLSGGTGLEYEQCIVVRAGHLDEAICLTSTACTFLMGCNGEAWQPLPETSEGRELVAELIARGLLIVQEGEPSRYRDADQCVRQGHWWSLSAIHHRHSRWAGVDSATEMVEKQMVTAADLVSKLGKPPAEAPFRQANAIALPLAEMDDAAFLLGRRATCRNYDETREISLETLAVLLQQVLMAQAQVETEPGVRFLKKNVPSAGSLHPIEAYVVARNVRDLKPGIYHYHAVAHELASASSQPDDLSAFSLRLLSGQHWFASAHVQIVLVCRFGRNFWKYRNHAKAYRAVTLDAGHISQAVYTAATAKGLGAFVTAAINESEIEGLLGLDPMQQGALAVCGFGWRSDALVTAELDPAGLVWKDGRSA